MTGDLSENQLNRLTQKQETFAQNLFKGMSQREAWTQAGYSVKYAPSIIDVNACVLANSKKIQLRWAELNEATKDASVATVLERKQVLTEVLRGRLTDYTTCGPDRDLISVGPESPNTAAFQEITSRTEFDKDGAGMAVITKLKLHSSIQAIAELNRMERVYETEGSTTIDNRVLIINVPSEQGKKDIERVMEGERT